MGMELDDVMHFGGKLEDKEWSYIYDNDLTVRKLYHLPRWGIVYDLGKEQGFYEKSGLKEYCKGKLNDRWFITDSDNPYKPSDDDDDEFFSSSSNINTYVWNHSLSINTSIILILSLVTI